MASTQCLTCTCYHHLHQHTNLSHKHPSNNYSTIIINAKKTSIISKTNIKRRIYELKAKKGNGTEDKIQTDVGEEIKKERRVRILIAGGGVGGLVLALAAKERGFDVMVFEKNLSAVRGEGRHRGPIQLMSGALGVLVGIDERVAKQVMDAGCVTGDRLNGLVDGLSGD